MSFEARFSLVDIDAQPYLTDLHAVSAYWRKLNGGSQRLAPSWQEFDLLQIPHNVLPRICVLDVIPEGPDFRYRFWGTAITAMHHYDLTGRSVLQLTPDHYAKCVWRQYRDVLESRAPLGFLTEVPHEDGRFSYYAVVRFPLSSDGTSIDMIISAEDYGEERGQLEKLFEDEWARRAGSNNNR